MIIIKGLLGVYIEHLSKIIGEYEFLGGVNQQILFQSYITTTRGESSNCPDEPSHIFTAIAVANFISLSDIAENDVDIT